ncbi:MAG: hypothetical protein K2N28_04395 [Muribaculaceae bacterium]|nr:hypothetical protein [Muribaculaceae bacterium]
MKKTSTLTSLGLGIIAMLASCTANGKLQQYVADTNITMAGKQIGPGLYCEGFTIDADTVIATYNIPEVAASPAELAHWNEIEAQYKKLFMEGLSTDKETDAKGAAIILDAGVYMKGVFKYQNATVNVLITPDELRQILK